MKLRLGELIIHSPLSIIHSIYGRPFNPVKGTALADRFCAWVQRARTQRKIGFSISAPDVKNGRALIQRLRTETTLLIIIHSPLSIIHSIYGRAFCSDARPLRPSLSLADC